MHFDPCLFWNTPTQITLLQKPVNCRNFTFCTNLISCTTILLKVQYGCPWLDNLSPIPVTSQVIMPLIRMSEALSPLQLELNWNSSWNNSLPQHTHTHTCHSILMSMHRESQITSEKLAILDCNHFIKSTMNWYPEVSKEPFYCILQILSKFSQLAGKPQIWLHLWIVIWNSFMVNYPILSSFPTLTILFPYLRFKACLDHLMAFSLVYRGTRSWSWWCHQGLWHHYCDVRACDPQVDPFSCLNLWICTHTLHTNLVTLWHSPPPPVSPVLRAEEVDIVLFTHLWNVLRYTEITSWTWFVPENVFYVLWIGDMTLYCGPFFRKAFQN